MFLSTFQPLVVWENLQNKGVYRADERLMTFSMPDFKPAYSWLVSEMEKRIGPRPIGVDWPVWAWHTHCHRTGRLDLRRSENWQTEPSVCIECDIPDHMVVLSDFDAWHCVLNNGILAYSEKQYNHINKTMNAMSPEQAHAFMEASWQGIFDLTLNQSTWCSSGDSIQATFWELRLEQVRNVRPCRLLHLQ